MKRLLCLAVAFLLFSCVQGFTQEDLAYHQVYKPHEGMSAEEIMQIKYFVKYTKFAHDYESTGYVYLIDKSGFTRERTFLRQRILLGRSSDGIAYKDLVMFTGPTAVKGLATLTWSYMDPEKAQNQWLWLPSLKKVRKISAAQADDSFMGSDFTVEEITLRRFVDETYSLLREEAFRGYRCEFNNQLYHQGSDCFVIEAKPKTSPWYYSKRIVWIDKNTGGDIYHEVYDPFGKLYKTIFKDYEIMKVEGRDYATQMLLEVKDLRTGHKSVIEMKNVKYDQGLSEELFTEKSLMRSRW
ncbi:MAG: outer membrane lipoprotein-sorting protein [Candidatus Omnitrophica bacterium]|nr:outer membrane lipoprotein-sorting protein [Candidatus Omnitrophota bacterium]